MTATGTAPKSSQTVTAEETFATRAPRSSRRDHAVARRAAWILGCLCLVSLIVPQLLSLDGAKTDLGSISLPPSLSSGHLLGTDTVGRDLFARSLQGLSMSLAVACFATIVSLVVGVIWGSVAGFLGGKVDELMMRIVDVLYAIPFVFLVILLMSLFDRSVVLVFVAVGMVNWLDVARIVRGQTLALRDQGFVDAARTFGTPTGVVLRRHIAPNLMGVVAVYVALTVPQVMILESFLSFLGLGVQEPLTSLGALVSEGAQDMETAPWLLLVPAVLLVTVLYCCNVLGDWTRDVLDPRTQ